jgi:hypothetical protein
MEGSGQDQAEDVLQATPCLSLNLIPLSILPRRGLGSSFRDEKEILIDHEVDQ